jgi:hypothetical protein
MPLQLYKIASVEVGSAGSSGIDFTSIPSGYTDLYMVYSLRNATENSGTLFWKVNGSTASLSFRLLYGSGAGAGSGSGTNEFGVTNSSGYTANIFSSGSAYIPNYTSSNNKSVSLDSVNENNASTAYSILLAGLWSSSSAITSIGIFPLSGNFAQYSTATLYGIL